MRVLVTGAAGNLGRVVVPALQRTGHEVRAFDQRSVDADCDAVVGDLRDPDSVRRAMKGCDAVVHGAALHGVHLRHWTEDDFWGVNATGTFNVYAAAKQFGTERVVLSSTMGVYGRSLEPSSTAWAVVTEESTCLPRDIYGLSKLLCERLAEFHARESGIVTVALRFGMYVPETFVRYGFRLLFGGVDDRDVAQAVLLALEHRPDNNFDFFNIMADTPFSASHAVDLCRDPAAVLERYWPGTTALIRERGLDLSELIWAYFMWPQDKAKQVLGYHPRHNFGEFVEAFRSNRYDYYPFAELAQWGVPRR